MGSVSLPVKVFCWLGWKEPSSDRPALGAVLVRGGRSAAAGGCPAAGRRRPRRTCPGRRSRPGWISRSSSAAYGQAVVALLRERLVGGRRAAHGRRYPRVPELQAVLGVQRLGLVREAGPVQRGEQPVSRAVAGEHAARCGSRRAPQAPGRARRRSRPGRRSRARACPSSPRRRRQRVSRAPPAPATPPAAGSGGRRRSRRPSSSSACRL